MRTEKFKVIEFIRQLLIMIDKELENFPKKEIELKNRIKTNSFDILELSYEANSIEDVKTVFFNRLQKRMWFVLWMVGEGLTRSWC